MIYPVVKTWTLISIPDGSFVLAWDDCLNDSFISFDSSISWIKSQEFTFNIIEIILKLLTHQPNMHGHNTQGGVGLFTKIDETFLKLNEFSKSILPCQVQPTYSGKEQGLFAIKPHAARSIIDHEVI